MKHKWHVNHIEIYGLPPLLAISGCLGEGGVNLVSAQRLAMDKTKPLLVIGLLLASLSQPQVPEFMPASISAVAPSKEFPSVLLLHAVWSLEDQGAID